MGHRTRIGVRDTVEPSGSIPVGAVTARSYTHQVPVRTPRMGSPRRRVERTALDARRPARLVATGFLSAGFIGTVALMLPLSSQTGDWTEPLPAFFTATSAVCVTGLGVLDTATHWSVFGQVAIMILIQVGGLGVMTLATLLGMLVSDHLGLRMGLTVMREGRGQGLGDLRMVILRILRTALVIEFVIAAILTSRFYFVHGHHIGSAVWWGIFHAVSAFNNAGFSLDSAGLVPYSTDELVMWPIAAAIVIGGLGFPVLLELRRLVGRRFGPGGGRRRLSVHTRLTLITYGLLLVVGVLSFLALEWTNQRTVGGMSVVDKITVAGFHGVTVRTAGFNSMDISQMHTHSWLVSDVLMFIGGGSAGTAGGLKVTTFALLAAVIWSEIQGERRVHVLGRSMAEDIQRQAVTVALLAVGTVFAATLVLSIVTGFTLDQILFEVISAFGTVGLTTGITPYLPAEAQLVVIALMYIGRLGPITLASSLALRSVHRHYDYPEDRVVVG